VVSLLYAPTKQPQYNITKIIGSSKENVSARPNFAKRKKRSKRRIPPQTPPPPLATSKFRKKESAEVLANPFPRK